MFLVVDSGSTKATWAASSSPLPIAVTCGLNPHIVSDDLFRSTLASLPIDHSAVSHLFFYGAGCGSPDGALRCRQLLSQAFPLAQVAVFSDLLGACRALLDNQAGLVGILGTGSNACFYDGSRIVSAAPSLGYVLGDQGSGNHIGRLLWQAFFLNTMPHHLALDFQSSFDTHLPFFINSLYHQPLPNRFLAQAAPFASRHISDPWIRQLLFSAFSEYLDVMVLPLLNPAVSPCLYLVGGVASAFSNIIASAAPSHLSIASILADPLPPLLQFHLNHPPKN